MSDSGDWNEKYTKPTEEEIQNNADLWNAKDDNSGWGENTWGSNNNEETVEPTGWVEETEDNNATEKWDLPVNTTTNYEEGLSRNFLLNKMGINISRSMYTGPKVLTKNSVDH